MSVVSPVKSPHTASWQNRRPQDLQVQRRGDTTTDAVVFRQNDRSVCDSALVRLSCRSSFVLASQIRCG